MRFGAAQERACGQHHVGVKLRLALDPGPVGQGRAGHAPRTGQIPRQQRIEPPPLAVSGVQIQRERQNRPFPRRIRHSRHDRQRTVAHELGERIEQHQIVAVQRGRDFVERGPGIVPARASAATRELLVEHRKPRRSKPLATFGVTIRGQHAHLAGAGGPRPQGDETAAVVAALADGGLRRAQRPVRQRPHAPGHLRGRGPLRFPAEEIDEAARTARFAPPADELRQYAVLQQIAGVSHVVGQRHAGDSGRKRTTTSRCLARDAAT